MVKSHQTSTTSTEPLARRERKPRLIGFIGKGNVSDDEAETLRLIGRSIARLGHTLISVPSKGATACVREGVEVEKGELHDIQSGVLEAAHHTLLYPSPQLLDQIRARYPDLEDKYHVTILQPHQLKTFWGAMQQIMAQEGISIPR